MLTRTALALLLLLPAAVSAQELDTAIVAPIGEGFSGGPVLQGGKVVGVITEMDDQTTYAVAALVANEALGGWGVKLDEPCIPGEKDTQNDIVFVHICPGTFTMGSAENDPLADPDQKPAHEVKLREL
jgi:hypothetical protein